MVQKQDIEAKRVSSLQSITRMSLGLFVAAIVLVVPLVVLVMLYLSEIQREIRLLDRQISSIRVMQQFVALQINLTDEYYSRFYPSSVALQQFTEQDNLFDAGRSRVGPVSLLTTQLSSLERELDQQFGMDFRTWPLIKERLMPLWLEEDWSKHLEKLKATIEPSREFINDLFIASNLELSTSEQWRIAANLLYQDIGQSKISLFVVTENLALMIFSPIDSVGEDEIRKIENSINEIYSVPLSERSASVLGQESLFSEGLIRKELGVDEITNVSRRLLEKKRRLMFIGALDGENNDMGLAVEMETLRGITWEKLNNFNRIQITLAQFLEYQLISERDSVSSLRFVVVLVVTLLAVSGIMLGTYIGFQVRAAQMHLRLQNTSLEAEIESRTKEIVSAKNEAEQLNRILGKQTQISTELARKAEMASSAKSLFLAAMSHEIRTPMNAVLGGATILSKTSLNSRQKNILSLITQSGRTLLDLINEILDFSKIEAGQLHLESISFDLEAAILNVVSMFSLKAKEKNIYLRTFVDSKVEGCWVGDPLRIKQIVINLLSNAIKFTHVGGISVRVTVNEMSHVIIGVYDTGIGIKPEHSKHLFEAFVQSDNSTTRKYGGTGLGLSISKRLAALHEGDISVESSLGRGSSFLLSLPLERSGTIPIIDIAENIKLFLLGDVPELERQLKQWYENLQVVDDVSQLNLYLNALTDEVAKSVVIVSESSVLALHHDQWGQQAIHRDVLCLNFPWVILMSEDAIDCEKSEELSREFCSFKVSIQLPVLSAGALIRKAIKSASSQPKNIHEDWVAGAEVADARKFKGRVLVVEDVEFNRVIARELLESAGLVVECAVNGIEAIDVIKKNYNFPDKQQYPIRLVLMDLHMPEMNGLDATRKIREFEQSSRLPSIPIVAMTADVLLDTREEIVQAGMDGYLPKPFEEAELYDILARYFVASEFASASKPKIIEANIPNSQVTDSASTSADDGVEQGELNVFDHEALYRRLRGREDRVVELTSSFLQNLPVAIEQMLNLVNASDYAALIFSAHTLKGSAANLGAMQLQYVAARIERLCKQLQVEDSESDRMALTKIVSGLSGLAAELEQKVAAYIGSFNRPAPR